MSSGFEHVASAWRSTRLRGAGGAIMPALLERCCCRIIG